MSASVLTKTGRWGRVLRGGAYWTQARRVRSANRNRDRNLNLNLNLNNGFRCAGGPRRQHASGTDCVCRQFPPRAEHATVVGLSTAVFPGPPVLVGAVPNVRAGHLLPSGVNRSLQPACFRHAKRTLR